MWQGADVVITSKPQIVEEGGFYPAPRYVVTSHAPELSWLFEQIRDIFIEINDYGFLKEEIFGRLGNTGNQILDDLISESEKGGFLTVEETKAYFKGKGIIE